MRALTASLITALLLCSCGAGIHRISTTSVTTTGVQVGTVDPNDQSTTTPNPSTEQECQLARGVKDGESVLEVDFGPDVKTAQLTIGSPSGGEISLGYDLSTDPRTEVLGLTVTKDKIEIMDGIIISGSSAFTSVIVELDVVLNDGTKPSTPCRLTIVPN